MEAGMENRLLYFYEESRMGHLLTSMSCLRGFTFPLCLSKSNEKSNKSKFMFLKRQSCGSASFRLHLKAFVSGVCSFHSLAHIQNIAFNCNLRKKQNQISLGCTAKWSQAGFYCPLWKWHLLILHILLIKITCICCNVFCHLLHMNT